MSPTSSSYEMDLDELTKPVKEVEEKWKLLPHFLRMRGLMRQHIDSFNHFICTDIKKIVQAKSNFEVRSGKLGHYFHVYIYFYSVTCMLMITEAHPKFFLRYNDIFVGDPTMDEDSFQTKAITPFQCRLRDCTYSAPIMVDISFVRGENTVVTKHRQQIGRIPIMLRSEKCVLTNKVN